MYFINLVIEAVNISETEKDIIARRQKLREKITYALNNELISEQDAEELNEIAQLKLKEKEQE